MQNDLQLSLTHCVYMEFEQTADPYASQLLSLSEHPESNSKNKHIQNFKHMYRLCMSYSLQSISYIQNG